METQRIIFIVTLLLTLCSMKNSLKIIHKVSGNKNSIFNILIQSKQFTPLNEDRLLSIPRLKVMQLSESARSLPDKELKSILLLSYGGLSTLSFALATFFGLLYFRSPLTLGHAASYLFFGIHSLLLYSACSRERLEATTFRILIPTLILSAVFNAVKVYSMKLMLSRAGHPATVIVNTEIVHGVLALVASATALRGYEIPNILSLVSKSFSSASRLAKAYLAAPLVYAAALLSSPLQSVALTSRLLYAAIWVQRAGSCLALSGAATVGPKRLASDTYRTLNKASLLLGSINLAHLFSSSSASVGISWQVAVAVAAEVLLVSTAGLGWKAAADYNRNLKS